ncbi:DUF1848 domain-containing protein [Campylobacter lari]|nr:DUF1848 domain-containing protein [Campylobacter lari]
MIISASRRTDIPAFYSKWFLNRLKEQYLLIKNPFNTKLIKRVSLKPENIDAIVFWTKNAKPIMQYLDEISKNYFYYFQYTITGYSNKIEQFTPNPIHTIENFIQLSDKIGKERVIWRYDPIVLTQYTPLKEHLRLFEKIATLLHNKTNKVIISFADPYKKINKRLNNLNFIDILSIDFIEFQEFIQNISYIANSKSMIIETCSENIDLEKFNINHGKCIDDNLIQHISNSKLKIQKDKYQRNECGCVHSVDIGMYNTCPHGCLYCYANFSDISVKKNISLHNENSPLLIGNIGKDELNKINSSDSLF